MLPRLARHAALALFATGLVACGGAPHAARTRVTPRPLPSALPRPLPHYRASRARVPVLFFHVVQAAPPRAAFPALWVPRHLFALQMAALAAHGYRGVSLQQVWNAWHGLGRLPRRPVVLSFDDGYRSDATNALPVLRAHHWPGVLNLEVAQLHSGLHASDVRRLIAAGWEVDAHTMTHPDLTRVGPRALRYEVAGSRAWIRRHFRVPVSFFCYPAGRFNARVVSAVRRAGYLAATTTAIGLASPREPRFELPRVRVTPGEGVAGLLRELAALARPGARTRPGPGSAPAAAELGPSSAGWDAARRPARTGSRGTRSTPPAWS